MGLIADVAAALAIIVGVIYWIVDARERDNQRYYTAWTEINTAPHTPIGESVDSPSSSTQHNGEHNSKNTWDPCIDPFRRVGDSGRSVALNELSLNQKSVAGAPLSYAVLPRVELSKANMDRADLRHADLFGAHLNGADLWAADLRNANMSFAHLEGSHMIYAQLENSCLQGAHLYNAHLYKRNYDHFISINETNFHLRAELEKKAHELQMISWLYSLLKTGTWKVYFSFDDVVVKTDLRCSNLKGADLRGADLEGANLRYANLEQAKLGEFQKNNLRSSL